MGFQRTSFLVAMGLIAAVGISTPSNAAMLTFQTFSGNGITTDDFGPAGGGNQTAHVPVGSTVVAAYLFKKGGAGSTGSFGGSPVTFDALGGTNPPDYGRAPVTIPPGPDPVIGDDEALVVVYHDPNNPDQDSDQGVLVGGECANPVEGTFCADVSDGTVGTGGVPPNNFSIALVQCDCGPPTEVPEPATLALFGAGLLGLGAIRRRLKKA